MTKDELIEFRANLEYDLKKLESVDLLYYPENTHENKHFTLIESEVYIKILKDYIKGELSKKIHKPKTKFFNYG